MKVSKGIPGVFLLCPQSVILCKFERSSDQTFQHHSRTDNFPPYFCNVQWKPSIAHTSTARAAWWRLLSRIELLNCAYCIIDRLLDRVVGITGDSETSDTEWGASCNCCLPLYKQFIHQQDLISHWQFECYKITRKCHNSDMTHIEAGIKFVVTDNRCDVNLNLLTSSTQASKGLLPATMEFAKLSTKALQPEAEW